MYIENVKSKQNEKIYTSRLLRESFREDGKVKHRTLLNLDKCPADFAEAIEFIVKNKVNLDELSSLRNDFEMRQGLSVGAVCLLYGMSKKLGIANALGDGHDGKLALWQVIARCIDGGSRLSAVRLAGSHNACDVLGIDKSFNEDDLYANLKWLSENQELIEKKLFSHFHKKNISNIFLYDVTSSYLEGEQNYFANFGYNRDKKEGKKQIVIGLLCDEEGLPISIKVYEGNTSDPKTFIDQIRKLSDQFGCKNFTLVGDRGMIKSGQIEALNEENFHYITAITKPQIETLLKQGSIQFGLFDNELHEVKLENNGKSVRYILRKNPYRAEEISLSRKDKKETIEKFIRKQNEYLKTHSRAVLEAALKKVNDKIERLRVSEWLSVEVCEREIILKTDENALAEISRLDGCYVLKSDVSEEIATKEQLYDQYKDLTLVEQAFRTSKSDVIELRPIYVQKEHSTEGHALVVMLSYIILRELKKLWKTENITTAEGIKHLDRLCSIEITSKNKPVLLKIPKPDEQGEKLLTLASIELPKILSNRNIKVASKKRLEKTRL